MKHILVVFALVASMFISALVHRVSATTWYFYFYLILILDPLLIVYIFSLIFSLISLFYINKVSQTIHAVQAPVSATPAKKKK